MGAELPAGLVPDRFIEILLASELNKSIYTTLRLNISFLKIYLYFLHAFNNKNLIILMHSLSPVGSHKPSFSNPVGWMPTMSLCRKCGRNRRHSSSASA